MFFNKIHTSIQLHTWNLGFCGHHSPYFMFGYGERRPEQIWCLRILCWGTEIGQAGHGTWANMRGDGCFVRYFGGQQDNQQLHGYKHMWRFHAPYPKMKRFAFDCFYLDMSQPCFTPFPPLRPKVGLCTYSPSPDGWLPGDVRDLLQHFCVDFSGVHA